MGVIAALYVATGGCYFGLDGVDPWDEARDARLYAGGFHSTEERRAATKRGVTERMGKRERMATPLPFCDLLLSIARSAPNA